jgi:predicted nucleic acid-binding protein
MSEMSGRVFIDSNILLYAVESQDVAKARRASEWLVYLLESGRGTTNLQVMNEVTNVLLKRRVMPAEQVFRVVDNFGPFGVTPISLETAAAARLIRLQANYQWWDCILLASAIELGCSSFLSEDLKDGHSFPGLTIISPFLHSPPQLPIH